MYLLDPRDLILKVLCHCLFYGLNIRVCHNINTHTNKQTLEKFMQDRLVPAKAHFGMLLVTTAVSWLVSGPKLASYTREVNPVFWNMQHSCPQLFACAIGSCSQLTSPGVGSDVCFCCVFWCCWVFFDAVELFEFVFKMFRDVGDFRKFQRYPSAP